MDSDGPDLRGDVLNVMLLTLLYILQGIPFGLSLAFPLILQNRSVSYQDQAEFKFVSFSFCFKLLWSPIVDSVYSKRMGRRKSWLIPTQYLIGIILMVISWKVDGWLGSKDSTQKPNVRMITVSFFLCILIASTQDIAIDGWSLTMLKRRNVGHASTCQQVGYYIGQFLAFVFFVVLDSADFCNKFRTVPQNKGFISLSEFIFFWAVMYMATTTLVLIFKKDNSLEVMKDGDECKLGLIESYRYLWQICKIRPVRILCFVLLTCQINYGPLQGVASLKLIDAGVSQDQYVLLTVPSLPFQIALPFLFSNRLTGAKSMDTFIFCYILKLILGALFSILIFLIPYVKNTAQVLPEWYYWLLVFMYNIDNITFCVKWIAIIAFFARVADPKFGGMYMTLLFTIANIGYCFPVSTSLWLLDLLTIKSCTEDAAQKQICWTVMDGFYVEVIACIVFGTFWIFWARKNIYKLQELKLSSWRLKLKPQDEKEKLSLNTSNYSDELNI